MARWHAMTDRTGLRSGKLTVVVFSHLGGSKSQAYWKARCDCGEIVVARGDHFARGAVVACKRCSAQARSERFTQHGAASGYAMTRLYSVWIAMRQRCSNPKNQDYRYYGGKGVAVCEGWQAFEAFETWARSVGYEEGLTIDRVNPRLGYQPDNCEWVTASENSRRMHVTRKAA